MCFGDAVWLLGLVWGDVATSVWLYKPFSAPDNL